MSIFPRFTFFIEKEELSHLSKSDPSDLYFKSWPSDWPNSLFWHSDVTRALLFSPPGCVRRCSLGTASRDNQVQPEVFEMFNTTGSSVPLSFAEHSSHQLPVYVCQRAHTHTHGDPTYYPGNSTSSRFLSRLPWVNPVNALWCVAFYTVYGWMCGVSVVRCFSLCFALEFPLTAGPNPLCLRVNTPGTLVGAFVWGNHQCIFPPHYTSVR